MSGTFASIVGVMQAVISRAPGLSLGVGAARGIGSCLVDGKGMASSLSPAAALGNVFVSGAGNASAAGAAAGASV
jgi:hypothetical protein